MAYTIYGLYDSLGKCRYIGQTRTARGRSDRHKHTFPHLVFRIIRRCDWNERMRLEKQIMNAYRAKGECDISKYPHKRIQTVPVSGVEQAHEIIRPLLPDTVERVPVVRTLGGEVVALLRIV